jgi:hypothetical protein
MHHSSSGQNHEIVGVGVLAVPRGITPAERVWLCSGWANQGDLALPL